MAETYYYCVRYIDQDWQKVKWIKTEFESLDDLLVMHYGLWDKMPLSVHIVMIGSPSGSKVEKIGAIVWRSGKLWYVDISGDRLLGEVSRRPESYRLRPDVPSSEPESGHPPIDPDCRPEYFKPSFRPYGCNKP